MAMKKGLIFSLFVLGVSSIISQVIVLRELTVSFYGNEFFIGVVLASWLFWVAVGSGVLGKILNRAKKGLVVLISLHFLLGAFFFLEIFLIRVLKTWIGFPGEIPNLVTALGAALLIPAPLCLILGLWWTCSTKIFCSPPTTFFQKVVGGKHSPARIATPNVAGGPAQAVNHAYFIETLGFILGGILFSFLLVDLQEFLIAGILFLLNLGVIIFLIFQQKSPALLRGGVVFLFLAFIFSVFSPQLTQLNKITAAFRFKGQELIESTNSLHGNVAITKIGPQYNFYESGLLVGTTQNIEFSEELIHFSLLQHPLPKTVLLIGGGFTGALSEILKHQPERIYYLELDPKLIEVSEKYISSEFQKTLHNPVVEIIYNDGRYFLQRTEEKFDAIILNLPDPSTALINRFYTQEFFAKAKEKLAPNGIFASYLSFSASTAGKNLENLNASIFKTLKQVFGQARPNFAEQNLGGQVIILPEETNFFLASNNENLTYQPEVLLQRFEQRNIETKFFSEEYITYRLSNDRIEKTLNLFEKNQEAKENKDFKPSAYFCQILFWLDHFYPRFSNFFKNLARSFWLIFAGVLLILTLILLKKRKCARKNFPMFSAAVAGFSLMALEIIIIFAYQISIGYLYYRLALLISALMAGMALGVWYGNKKLNKAKYLPVIHSLLIIFCAILPLVLDSTKEIVFLILALIAGFLGAAIFPLANQIYLSSQSEPHKKTGTIYAANLLGSCFGALLPGLILIPVFGVWQALIFVAVANLWIVLILPFFKNLGGEDK